MVLPVVRKCMRRLYLVFGVAMATGTLMYIFPDGLFTYGKESQVSHESAQKTLRRLSEDVGNVIHLDTLLDGDGNDDDDEDNGEGYDKDDDVNTDNDNDDNDNDDDDTVEEGDDDKEDDGGDQAAGQTMEKQEADPGKDKQHDTFLVRAGKDLQDARLNVAVPKAPLKFVPKKKAQKVVILTYMRSGSTLTGDLFQHHPDVFYSFEPLWRLQKYYNNKSQVIGYLNRPPVRATWTIEQFWTPESLSTQVLSDMLNCRMKDLDTGTLRGAHMGTSISTRPYSQCISSFKRSLQSIKDCFPLLQQACDNASVSVVKTIRYTSTQLGDLLASDPGVKVIHLFRDPRGTYLSQSRVGEFRKVDVQVKFGRFCNRMLEDLYNTMQLPKESRDRILLVRYEDIVQYPIAAAKFMYDFVGLELTEKLKEYIWNITYAGNYKDPNCKQLCTARSNSTDTANKWRRWLQFKTVQMVDSLCPKVYEVLGYRHFQNLEEFKSTSYSSKLDEIGAALKPLKWMSLKELERMPESKSHKEIVQNPSEIVLKP